MLRLITDRVISIIPRPHSHGRTTDVAGVVMRGRGRGCGRGPRPPPIRMNHTDSVTITRRRLCRRRRHRVLPERGFSHTSRRRRWRCGRHRRVQNLFSSSSSSELFLHRHVSTTNVDDVINPETDQTRRGVCDEKTVHDD